MQTIRRTCQYKRPKTFVSVARQDKVTTSSLSMFLVGMHHPYKFRLTSYCKPIELHLRKCKFISNQTLAIKCLILNQTSRFLHIFNSNSSSRIYLFDQTSFPAWYFHEITTVEICDKNCHIRKRFPTMLLLSLLLSFIKLINCMK